MHVVDFDSLQLLLYPKTDRAFEDTLCAFFNRIHGNRIFRKQRKKKIQNKDHRHGKPFQYNQCYQRQQEQNIFNHVVLKRKIGKLKRHERTVAGH